MGLAQVRPNNNDPVLVITRTKANTLARLDDQRRLLAIEYRILVAIYSKYFLHVCVCVRACVYSYHMIDVCV